MSGIENILLVATLFVVLLALVYIGLGPGKEEKDPYVPYPPWMLYVFGAVLCCILAFFVVYLLSGCCHFVQ